MKNRFFTFSLLLGFVILSSCSKKDSVISGQITYKGAITGIEYIASGAVVQLHMGAVGQTGNAYMSTTADENGVYNFVGLMDGNWTVNASTTVNGFNYYGESGVVTTNGKDGVTANFVLE